MLSKASWLPLAEKLDLQDGRSRRVDHDCGDGRTLLISRSGPKLSAHCFRCNDGGFHHSEEALVDRIARLARGRAADQEAQGSNSLPNGSRAWSEWPALAKLWLARAGLSSGDAGLLGAYYSQDLGRLVLPCGGGFWQARSIDGRQPKYIAPIADKVYPRYGSAERVTLTEDILSAYKVGKVGEGWCMLGTSLPHEFLAAILKRGCAVNVWLDNDIGPAHLVNRGQIAAAKVAKQLRSAGVSVRNIVTLQDPKLIHLNEIKELTL